METVINGVKAIAYGLEQLLTIFCGPNSNKVCSQFVTQANRGQEFVTELYKVSFQDFRFRGRTLDLGFDIYNYQNSEYKMVSAVYDTDTNHPLKIYKHG